MKKAKVLIIEDESGSYKSIKGLLNYYYNDKYDLQENEAILGKGKFLVTNIYDGQELIQKTQPDLIFMDINLPNTDAFKIIELFDCINFWVVFVTGYKNRYAFEAWNLTRSSSSKQLRGIDYFSKPFTKDKLDMALQKFEKHRANVNLKKILINSKLQKVGEIVKFHTDKSTVNMYLNVNGNITKSIITKSITDLCNILPSDNFCKINQHCIINKLYISSYSGSRENFRVILEGIDYSYQSEKGEKVTRVYLKAFKEWLAVSRGG